MDLDKIALAGSLGLNSMFSLVYQSSSKDLVQKFLVGITDHNEQILIQIITQNLLLMSF